MIFPLFPIILWCDLSIQLHSQSAKSENQDPNKTQGKNETGFFYLMDTFNF